VTPTTVWQISPFHSLVFRSISATIAKPEFQPFLGTNPTGELITSGLPVTQEQSPRYQNGYMSSWTNLSQVEVDRTVGDPVSRRKTFILSTSEIAS
jgi:hypothetical protein